jgi:hypothetical protein
LGIIFSFTIQKYVVDIMKITMFSFFKAIVYRLRSQHTSRLTLLDTLLAIN